MARSWHKVTRGLLGSEISQAVRVDTEYSKNNHSNWARTAIKRTQCIKGKTNLIWSSQVDAPGHRQSLIFWSLISVPSVWAASELQIVSFDISALRFLSSSTLDVHLKGHTLNLHYIKGPWVQVRSWNFSWLMSRYQDCHTIELCLSCGNTKLNWQALQFNVACKS